MSQLVMAPNVITVFTLVVRRPLQVLSHISGTDTTVQQSLATSQHSYIVDAAAAGFQV